MALGRPGCPAAALVAWALVGSATPVEGGLKTRRRPSDRGALGGPRRLQQNGQLGGLGYVASGYDVYFGNPDPTSGAVDDGFRSQVFNFNFNSSIPVGISTLQCEDSCSLTSKVSTITSMAQYQDFLSSSASVEVGFADIAMFSASLDFQRVREGFSDHESVYTTVVAHCCAYEAFVHTYKPPPADDNFLAAVDMAPVDYDQDFYFQIIGEFGTHFLSSAQLGGMYGQETEFTHDQYNNMQAATNDWSMQAQASFIVSFSAGVASQSNWTSKDFFDKYSTTTRQYSLGAMPPQSGDPEAWMAQTISQPVPTSMTLKPLSELFTTLLVPNEENQTKLNAKKNNMERALQEYCPEKLLKEGKVDSCEKIVNDPNATAVDEKTCLAKVWGGGGPNGQQFDDSNALVELYGLFESVQVAQIMVQSDRWLNNIKLVLSRGNDEWPLQEHGGKGGFSETLTFSDGQKITAVALGYDRYVDGITFWSNDGQEQNVGGTGGAYSKMVNFRDAVWNATGRLPREAWLVGLYGHSQKYVDSLGFYVAYTCSASEVPGPAGLPAGARGLPAGAPGQDAANATDSASTTDAADAADAASSTDATSSTDAADASDAASTAGAAVAEGPPS